MKTNHSGGAITVGAERLGAVGAPALVRSDKVRKLPTLEETHPNSRKVAVGAMQVPMREISLAGGRESLRVYDTTGPQGCDPRVGLPKLRQSWIEPRERRGDKNFSQMHYARAGVITEEMRFVAER